MGPWDMQGTTGFWGGLWENVSIMEAEMSPIDIHFPHLYGM
jgi:hypothetical protein